MQSRTFEPWMLRFGVNANVEGNSLPGCFHTFLRLELSKLIHFCRQLQFDMKPSPFVSLKKHFTGHKRFSTSFSCNRCGTQCSCLWIYRSDSKRSLTVDSLTFNGGARSFSVKVGSWSSNASNCSPSNCLGWPGRSLSLTWKSPVWNLLNHSLQVVSDR